MNALSNPAAAPRARDARARRLLAVSLIALLLALTPGIVALFRYPPPLGTRRLPDGTVVSLEAVTYGTAHQFIDGTWCQRIAYALLPAALAERLGGEVLTQGTPTPQLVCWFRIRSGSGRLVGVDVAGDQGCDPGGNFGGWFSGGPDMIPCPITHFPRRGKQIRVRLCSAEDDSRSLLAEFVAPNPATGPFPTWTPEPLPSTKRDGPLAVTLVSLASGLKPPRWADRDTGEAGWTHLRLRIRPVTPDNRDCRPSALTLADATGNTWQAPMPAHRRRRDGDWDCWVHTTLCPEEPACKLRVECTWIDWSDVLPGALPSAIKRFPPESVLQVQDVPVPPAGKEEMTGPKASRQGIKLGFGPVERGRGKKAGLVTVYLREWRAAVGGMPVISLVRAADQRGRVLEVWQSAIEGAAAGKPVLHSYTLALRPGSVRLTLVFRVHRRRFAQFVVRAQNAP